MHGHRLADLIGPMLGADFLYAEGELHEINSELPAPHTHRFWAFRNHWRVERDDDIVFIDGPDGSATLAAGRVREAGALRHGPGFHLAERLLRPRFAPIWGRPGDDWRLTDGIEADGDLVRVALEGTEGRYTERASILIDPRLGRLHRLTTPGFEWKLLRLQEESTGDPAGLFALPPAALAVSRNKP